MSEFYKNKKYDLLSITEGTEKVLFSSDNLNEVGSLTEELEKLEPGSEYIINDTQLNKKLIRESVEYFGKHESGLSCGINDEGELFFGDSESGYNLKDTSENREFILNDWMDETGEDLADKIFSEGLNEEDALNEEVIDETYSKDELKKLIGKTYNQQKVENIYRRKKYGDRRLFAHTKCNKCGREKKVYLSNLINDTKKYGSCICSNENIDSKIDYASKLYTNVKKLRNNTSGYTGVSFVKNYGGQLYNKWRAYIEVDGKRTYLGDFTNKADAIRARKVAGEQGVKWYRANKNRIMRDVRKKSKKFKNSKYRDVIKKPDVVTKKDK